MLFLFNKLRSSLLFLFWSPLSTGMVITAGLTLAVFSVIGFQSTAQAEPAGVNPNQPARQDAAQGKAIFDQKCSGCHSIGAGKLVGPDLKDVTKRRDPQWIKFFITDPAKMIASDPIAQQLLKDNNNLTMPTLGLTSEQVDQLVAFLSNPGSVPAGPAGAAPAGGGDPTVGQRLFTGETSLANGGPACMACHTVNGAATLGGGSLGPDLTHVFGRFGPGLSAALKNIAFPTMRGPFQGKPLTLSEQADLVAFFEQADRAQEPVVSIAPGTLTFRSLVIFAIALGGAVLLFVLLWILWAPIKKRFIPQLPVRKF